jgi:hypothetical protein
MHISIAGLLGVASLWFAGLSVSPVCIAQAEPTQAQSSQPQPVQPPHAVPVAQDGGVREVLESIVIPPIPHAPFFATLDTEWVKYTADGATITLVNERHIARDAQGRIYEERWGLAPRQKDGSFRSVMTWIQIADPIQRTLYNCSIQKHICDLLTYDPAPDLAAATQRKGPSGTLTRGNRTWEDLGTRNIAGVDTVGTRETTTIEAGKMGNDQPLTSMSEFWHAPDLGINLLSIRTSPMFGKETFSITEITPGDPDAQLFELPADYKISDQRKNPPISR